MEGKGSDSFWEVPKRTCCCAFLEATECFFQDNGVNGDGRWRSVTAGGSMGGLVRGWWGVEFLASGLHCWGDGCHWH